MSGKFAPKWRKMGEVLSGPNWRGWRVSGKCALKWGIMVENLSGPIWGGWRMSGKCGLKRRNMGKSLGAYLWRAAGVRKMCSQIAKDGTKSLGANPGRAAGVREGGVKWRKKGENPSRPIWGGRRVYGNVLSNGEKWKKISRCQSGEGGSCTESVIQKGKEWSTTPAE